jgi:hypothetical protein
MKIHNLSAVEFLGCVTPPKPRPVVATRREAVAAENTTDVDVEQQLLGELANGDGVPDGPVPDVPHLDVPLPDVPRPDVPLPDVPFPEARPDGSVGEE